MKELKKKIKSFSCYRKVYIFTLFFCNVSFLQIPAYILVAFLFCWGIWLTYYKQKTNNTFFKLRFGLWVWGFLAVSLLTMLLNFTYTIFYSALMFLHILICFFIFYGMHTEPDFDFKNELYTVARGIVYITTIANFIGIFCLMFNIRFEWYWIKFTIYENRFTGIYINPNLLGFVSCVAIFCCHILCKPDFQNAVNQRKVSKIWIIACVCTSLFSLLLCDSNASMVLILAYMIVYIVYQFFAAKDGLSPAKVTMRIVALVLVGTFLVGSSLMFREICQQGFAVVTAKTYSLLDEITEKEQSDTDEQPKQNDSDNNKTAAPSDKGPITFEHENSNIDSGRFKLYRESLDLFKISPVFGISSGNIVFYSQEYANGTLKYTYHNNDLHNGFLTILVSTGVLGFVIFGIFGFRFAKHAAQHLFLQKKTFKNDAYPCMFAFLSAYLFYALFEKALLYDISFMVMWFWLIMGYTSCYIAKFEPMLETRYLFHQKRLHRSLL